MLTTTPMKTMFLLSPSIYLGQEVRGNSASTVTRLALRKKMSKHSVPLERVRRKLSNEREDILGRKELALSQFSKLRMLYTYPQKRIPLDLIERTCLG
jgi:hypothetical protein